MERPEHHEVQGRLGKAVGRPGALSSILSGREARLRNQQAGWPGRPLALPHLEVQGEQLTGQGPPSILHGSLLPGGHTGPGGARTRLSLETTGVAS